MGLSPARQVDTWLLIVVFVFLLIITASVKYNREMERARPICKVKDTYIVDGVEKSCNRVKRHYRGSL